MSEKTYNVLFICAGNSARSVLAESLINRYGGGRFHGFGRSPAGQARPGRSRPPLVAYREHEIHGRRVRFASSSQLLLRSPSIGKSIERSRSSALGCTVPLGKLPALYWGIPDPAAADGSEAEKDERLPRMLERRIKVFLALPIASLDRLLLTSKVEAIGRLRDDAAENRAP